ncbi:restriction endonuclease subunit S [Salmonella enterica]|uniref:Restriction endonuclease subunit S n=1 Tax=Salmonella enterica subsp. enterica serovar Ank TaxID=1173578 RepID=A0A5I2X619_SALET|nr:restriction endonuclease subunit S [Salmonella enterica subsp. enterica serovar Ank]EDA8441045.1 restriction endonuclease subunit S [Salmonella enterica subsp. enterica serovar Bakau]EDW1724829.1 restriction endonuclease subunit S [Salmonella enterica subsp. enterica]EID3145778.1 restriction endonuclease subunit S [Salmonella enterica]HER1265030.1 restriction endonuclease subunit S [Salmonella enterica subsp. enterica serovar 28:e,h:z6]
MDFDEYSFADLLSNIVDNRGKTCPVEDEGFPLIATNCIKDDSLYPVFEKVRFVSDDTYKNWFRGHPNAGDIIFVCKGSPGRVAWVKEPVSFCIAQDMVAIRADQRVVDPMFLFSLLRSEQVINKINNMHVGTLIPHFKKGDFKNLYLSIPRNMKLQRAIGLFYFSLSEKIEKNKEINQTLEQMAQALFKSWFVDFEPVKAKMAALEAGGSQEDATLAAMTAISGKDADALAFFEREHPEQYAELKATAELFPSAMQDSELGKIPEGWSIKPLDGIATYQNGLALQKFRPENENDFLPVVKIAQLKKGFSDGEEKASPNIKPECIIDNGDVVFSWSGSLMVDIWCGGQAALNQHLFKVSSTKYPKWLYYKYTAHHLIEFQRIAEAKAVTMGHIKREHLSQAKCLIPSSETICAFTPFFEPVLNRVISNRLESRKLENLRDTLLPKLLSGEITLPEAEQIISEEA